MSSPISPSPYAAEFQGGGEPHTLSRPRTTKRTGRRSLPSTMLRPQIHLLIWTRRAAEAKAPGSRFSEVRRRRTNTRYIYTHIRTSFRPFLGSTAKRLRENRYRSCCPFPWTFNGPMKRCHPSATRIRIPLPLFLLDRVAVTPVPAARKVCAPPRARSFA
jgi:hypothetical protein